MNKFVYEIYQIDIRSMNPFERDKSRIFFSLPEDQAKVDLKKDHYVSRYKGTLESKSVNPYHALNELFRIFNVEHPADFKGHSLSVSDIVVLNGQAYHCESFGWKEVELIGE